MDPIDLTVYFHSNEDPSLVRTPRSTSLERYVEIVLRGTSSSYIDLYAFCTSFDRKGLPGKCVRTRESNLSNLLLVDF